MTIEIQSALAAARQRISEPGSGFICESADPHNSADNFFVRSPGRPERFQNIAEVNIIGIAVYSSKILYAQLTFLAKLRTKDARPSFSAGTVLLIVRHKRNLVQTKKVAGALSWTFGFI